MIVVEGKEHRRQVENITYGARIKISDYLFSLLFVDPPRFDAEELEAFQKTVTVKKGHKAIYKLPFIGREPIKVQWYLDGEELSDEANIKLEHSDGGSRLILTKLQRKDSGEVKIKLKNEFGTVEAFSQLVVLGMHISKRGLEVKIMSFVDTAQINTRHSHFHR